MKAQEKIKELKAEIADNKRKLDFLKQKIKVLELDRILELQGVERKNE